MYGNKTIAVVVPAYNEEALIARTIESVPNYADMIIVVDDASTDRTAVIADGHVDARTRVVRHEVNKGVGAAIVSGYKSSLEAVADICVVMAGDFQMDPVHLMSLVAPIADGVADYAKGDRLSAPELMEGMSLWRRTGNRLLTWLTRIAAGSSAINEPQNGYAAISRSAIETVGIDSIYPRYGYCNDLLVRLTVAGQRIVNVPMPAKYGDESSGIKYYSYIPSVSWLRLKLFVWRLATTWRRRRRRR